jgi:hypothetical protein
MFLLQQLIFPMFSLLLLFHLGRRSVTAAGWGDAIQINFCTASFMLPVMVLVMTATSTAASMMMMLSITLFPVKILPNYSLNSSILRSDHKEFLTTLAADALRS